MNAQTTHNDDEDMPAEIDFSGAERGKFYKSDLRLISPLHLEPQVQDTLQRQGG